MRFGNQISFQSGLKRLCRGQVLLEFKFLDEPVQIDRFIAEFRRPFEILDLCPALFRTILSWKFCPLIYYFHILGIAEDPVAFCTRQFPDNA